MRVHLIVSLIYDFSTYLFLYLFFFNDTAPTDIYTLSLHDALPIYRGYRLRAKGLKGRRALASDRRIGPGQKEITANDQSIEDRKSTRLNSSHQIISYAVFCLKKKKNRNEKRHVY